ETIKLSRYSAACHLRDECARHGLRRAFGEYSSFGRSRVGAVPQGIDAGILGLQRAWIDRPPPVLRQATVEHRGWHAVFGHAEKQIECHLRVVVEKGDPTLVSIATTRLEG